VESDWRSELDHSRVRLEVLRPSGPVLEAQVELVSGRQVRVACECALELGTAVQLDTAERILLGEVIALDRTPDHAAALLDVQHFLLKSDLRHFLSHIHKPEQPPLALEGRRP
jgi:hypothetical protein